MIANVPGVQVGCRLLGQIQEFKWDCCTVEPILPKNWHNLMSNFFSTFFFFHAWPQRTQFWHHSLVLHDDFISSALLLPDITVSCVTSFTHIMFHYVKCVFCFLSFIYPLSLLVWHFVTITETSLSPTPCPMCGVPLCRVIRLSRSFCNVLLFVSLSLLLLVQMPPVWLALHLLIEEERGWCKNLHSPGVSTRTNYQMAAVCFRRYFTNSD